MKEGGLRASQDESVPLRGGDRIVRQETLDRQHGYSGTRAQFGKALQKYMVHAPPLEVAQQLV